MAKLIILATALCFVAVLAEPNYEILVQKMRKMKEQCEKHGGNFEIAMGAPQAFFRCIKFVETTSILGEVLAKGSKNNSALKQVLETYCDQKSLFKACIGALTNSTLDCYAVERQKNLKIVYNVIEKLLVDFMCFKKGDGIASFISEGGWECVKNRKVGLDQCYIYYNKPHADFGGIIDMDFEEEQCKQLTDLQHCLVSELEKCTKPAAANFFESLYNFIRESTPCKNFKNVASSLAVTSVTIIVAVATAIIL